MMTTMLQFKVWDIHNKRFLEGYKELSKYFHGFCNDNEHSKDKNYKQCIGLSFWKVPDGYFKICRYSGKKDKNGIKLYLGDIIKYGSWCIKPDDKGTKIPCLYELHYDKLRSYWAFIPLQPVLFEAFKIEDSEFIGHKLSHPELLKYVTEDMKKKFREDQYDKRHD